jgi:hypothetical protein
MERKRTKQNKRPQEMQVRRIGEYVYRDTKKQRERTENGQRMGKAWTKRRGERERHAKLTTTATTQLDKEQATGKTNRVQTGTRQAQRGAVQGTGCGVRCTAVLVGRTAKATPPHHH